MKSGLEYAGSNKLVWSVMVGISVPVRCTAPKYHDGPSRLTCMDLGKWSEPQPPCKREYTFLSLILYLGDNRCTT